MPEVTSPPASGGSSADTTNLILADLGAGGAGDNTGSVDPAIAEEINAIPGDEEAAEQPIPVEGQQAEETPAVEDDTEKPAIQNLEESRWKRVHAGYKYTQEVGRALGVVGEDGRVDLSLFPSVDEIKGMRSAYSDRIAMEHDFASADPANAQQFVENWNTFSPEGMAAVAQTLPDYLAKANQAAYRSMAAPVMSRFLDYMYSAPGVDTPELRQRILDAARVTEWWLNAMPSEGGYRTDQQIQGIAPAGQQQEADPREQRLTQREQQIRDYEQRTTAAAWDGFAGGVNAEIKQSLDAEIEKAMAPLKGLYPNEFNYQAVRDKFVQQFQQTLKQDQIAQRQFDVAIERARRTRSADDQKNLVGQYMTTARRAIHTIRGTFVTNASKGIKNDSDARHAAMQRSAAKVGATSASAPRPQGVTPKLEPRRKDETGAEFQHRMVLADLA